RLRHAGGLEHDAREIRVRRTQLQQGAIELVAEHAAHAAAGQLDLARRLAAEQRRIDADRAELVDDDAELAGLAPRRAPREQPVDERGLAAAEKPGDNEGGQAPGAQL